MVINQEMGMGMGIARASERRSSQSEIYLILSLPPAAVAVGLPGAWRLLCLCLPDCLIPFRGRIVEVGLRFGVRHNSRACKVILAQLSVSQSVSL